MHQSMVQKKIPISFEEHNIFLNGLDFILFLGQDIFRLKNRGKKSEKIKGPDN